MSEVKVRAAIVSTFVAGAFFEASRIAQENVKFVPPTSGPWAEIIFLPTQPYIATLGAGGQDRLDAIVQIDLNYPLGSGEEAVGAKADAIRNTFTVGRRCLYQGVEVVIRSCGRSQGMNKNGFYCVPVNIVFYAHLNR